MAKEMEHGQLSGWQVLSTAGPSSTIPQPFIEDAALIIDRMVTKGEIKKLLDSIKSLEFHLTEDPDPHMLRLSQFSALLLHNIYVKYRELGYITDQEEMYRRMFYDLDVASWAEVYKGVEATKALNVPGFRYLTDTHEEDINAHDGIFAKLIDKNPCNNVPVISFKHQVRSRGLVDEVVDNKTITSYKLQDEWCPTQGTFVVGCTFKVKDSSIPILTIKGINEQLFLSIETNKTLMVTYTTNDMPNILFIEDLMMYEGNIQVAFTYADSQLFLKSTLSEKTQTLTLNRFRLNAESIILDMPLVRDAINGSIRSFWYYSKPVTSGSMLTSILT